MDETTPLVDWLDEFLSRNIHLGDNVLPATWKDLIFGFLLPVIGIYVLIRVIVFFVKRLVTKSQLKEESKTRVLRWFRLVHRLLFLAALIVLAARLLGDQIVQSFQSVFSFLSEPFFESGDTRVSVITLLFLIPIFYIAAWIGNWSRRMLERGVLDRLNLDASRRFSVVSVLRYTIMAVVMMIGLSIIGINLSSLAVVFGVLGIGLGFGLQGIVANFFAGMIIIISRPIKEGDRIHVGEHEGDVQHIRILYSVVKTITDETIIIPNRQIVENSVHNQSYDDPSITLLVPVQVAYRSDLDRVRETLMTVGQNSPYRNGTREPKVVFRSFDDSGITVALAVPIQNARDRYMARSAAIVEIWRAFRNNGIEIPFPQRDVYLKSMSGQLSTGESGDSLGFLRPGSGGDVALSHDPSEGSAGAAGAPD
jgi:potassium efflux system protein